MRVSKRKGEQMVDAHPVAKRTTFHLLLITCMVLMVGIGVISITVWLLSHTRNPMTLVQVRARVQLAIPPKSTRATVHGWLSSQKIPFDVGIGGEDQYGNETVIQESGVAQEKVSSVTRAYILGANRTLLSSTVFYIYFLFDQDDHMITIVVQFQNFTL
jgi:hypothetical protein